MNLDLIGTGLAAVLTFFVLGYLLGDVPGLGAMFKFFYRLAMYILVGASVGYAISVGWWSVFYPRVMIRLMQAWAANDILSIIITAIGVGLGLLLLSKSFRTGAWLGNLATGYLVGVGLGVSLAGAMLGTLVAQSQAAASLAGAGGDSFQFTLEALLMVLATVTVLIAFNFTATARKGPLGVASRAVAGLAVVGRLFIYIALGVVFAGVYAASVAMLAGRLQFLISAFAMIGKTLGQ